MSEGSEEHIQKLMKEVLELRREVAKLRRSKKKIEEPSLKGRLSSLILPLFILISLIIIVYVGKDVAESKMSQIRFLGMSFFTTFLFALFVLCILLIWGIINEVSFGELFKYSLQEISRGLRSLFKRKKE